MAILSPDDRSWNCLLKLKGCVHTCHKTLVNVQFLVFHAKYTTQLGILATFTSITKMWLKYQLYLISGSNIHHQPRRTVYFIRIALLSCRQCICDPWGNQAREIDTLKSDLSANRWNFCQYSNQSRKQSWGKGLFYIAITFLPLAQVLVQLRKTIWKQFTNENRWENVSILTISSFENLPQCYLCKFTW